jgi:hypothetical protein
VTEGADILDTMDFSYDDQPLQHQWEFQQHGNSFMLPKYPNLDKILSCKEITNM